MHFRRKALRCSHPLQQPVQKLGLAWVQTIRVGLLADLCHLANLTEEQLAVLGESNLVDAPILRAATAFDEAVLFELIQNRNDSARAYPDLLTEHTLADSRSVGDQAEDSGFRCGDLQGPQLLLEPARRIRAELREQERNSMVRPRRGVHGVIIALLLNNS